MDQQQMPAGDGYHGRIRTDVIPLVPRGGGTLLDVGGGFGATAVRLKSLGHADRVGVVDLIPAGALPDRDFSYSGNLEDPALLDRVATEEGPFTTILCLDVLEHLVDPWQVVARLHAALAPDGVIVASVPNVRHYSALLPLLLRGRWTLTDAGILDRTHLRFFVRDSAIALMTGSGLVLEDVRARASGAGKIRVFRRLTLGLLNRFTDLQYLIRVRRADP